MGGGGGRASVATDARPDGRAGPGAGARSGARARPRRRHRSGRRATRAGHLHAGNRAHRPLDDERARDVPSGAQAVRQGVEEGCCDGKNADGRADAHARAEILPEAPEAALGGRDRDRGRTARDRRGHDGACRSRIARQQQLAGCAQEGRVSQAPEARGRVRRARRRRPARARRLAVPRRRPSGRRRPAEPAGRPGLRARLSAAPPHWVRPACT